MCRYWSSACEKVSQSNFHKFDSFLIFEQKPILVRARGGAVCKGTALQAGAGSIPGGIIGI
jgi:hypothetical protein